MLLTCSFLFPPPYTGGPPSACVSCKDDNLSKACDTVFCDAMPTSLYLDFLRENLGWVFMTLGNPLSNRGFLHSTCQ